MITRNQPHSVLVVDDEPNIVTALEFLLEQEGFHVRKAYNGQQALDILQRYNDIELVILDVMMPGIDGFEVARQIRNNHLHENLRIIFLTAKGTQKDKITGYSRGAEAYITKPFDNEDLLITVTEMVEFG
jgi:DNA-binding response OmpR family regulator